MRRESGLGNEHALPLRFPAALDKKRHPSRFKYHGLLPTAVRRRWAVSAALWSERSRFDEVFARVGRASSPQSVTQCHLRLTCEQLGER